MSDAGNLPGNDLANGSVNANRPHYEVAAEALDRANHAWMTRLITQCVPLVDWQLALSRRTHCVKVFVEIDSPS